MVATVEPYHVLGSEGVEIQGFQGLLPTIVVLALRAVVVAGERYLLPVPHGPMMVACARLASLAGFFYIGRWGAVRAHVQPLGRFPPRRRARLCTRRSRRARADRLRLQPDPPGIGRA